MRINTNMAKSEQNRQSIEANIWHNCSSITFVAIEEMAFVMIIMISGTVFPDLDCGRKECIRLSHTMFGSVGK